MKEIKDYLHLYLGCEVMFAEKLIFGNSEDRKGLFNSMDDKYVSIVPITRNGVLSSTTRCRKKIEEVKPILRQLSDMSEEESIEWNTLFQRLDHARDKSESEKEAERTMWLLSKHFDLFNLIPEGLAIDKTTLK